MKKKSVEISMCYYVFQGWSKGGGSVFTHTIISSRFYPNFQIALI